MTTFIKVNYDENADQNTVSEIDQKIRQLKLTNQKLARNSRAGNVFESIHNVPARTAEVEQPETTVPPLDNESAKVEETIVFREVITRQEEDSFMDVNSGSRRKGWSWQLSALIVLCSIVLGIVRH
uniref:Uncharacterized protein n=1 Tax=Anopheles maculatus TaxID=74869 RepID=A0A182S721_9DIPT